MKYVLGAFQVLAGLVMIAGIGIWFLAVPLFISGHPGVALLSMALGAILFRMSIGLDEAVRS